MYSLNFSLSALGCPQPKDAEYTKWTADFEASSACRVAGNARILPPFAQAVSAEQTKGGKTACANGVQEYVRLSTLRRICTQPAQEVAVLIRALGQNSLRDFLFDKKEVSVKRRTENNTGREL